MTISSTPNADQIVRHLRQANVVAKRSMDEGNHPFGCIIVGPDHETIICEQGNVDTVEHAEAVAIRTVWTTRRNEPLWQYTVYTTVEPCAMCAGTLYWANIGCVVFGISEATLRQFTGNDPRNPTLNLPCHQVFSSGTKDILVVGPVIELQQEIMELHEKFWRTVCS